MAVNATNQCYTAPYISQITSIMYKENEEKVKKSIRSIHTRGEYPQFLKEKYVNGLE